MATFLEHHQQHICGELSCLDRVVITGPLPRVCYAGGMTGILYDLNVPIFDDPAFVEPLACGMENT